MAIGDYTRSTPLVSVVMVSYHTGESLWVAIDSVLKQDVHVELIIVNNGNPTDTAESIQTLANTDERLIFVSGHGNIGFARACNLGARYARAPYLLLLNPDCILPPRGLRMMVDEFRIYPEAVLAGPLLVDPAGREQRGSRRSLLTPRSAVVEALFLHRLLPKRFGHQRLNRHETGVLNATQAVPAISGAFLFMEKARFDAIGGMDEGYFLHVEDLDFCLRMKKTGGATIIVPSVQVVHVQGTSQAPYAKIEWHKAIGFMRYFYLHYGRNGNTRWLPLLYTAAFSRFLLRSVAGTLLRSISGGTMMRSDTKAILLLHRYLRQTSEDRPLAGRTVLVTGALGQVGLCIVGRLIQGGAWVLALSRSRILPVSHSRLRYLQGNLGDLYLPDDSRIDTVIHAAPLWLLPGAIQVFAAFGVKRIVAFGSTSVFSKRDSTLKSERELAVRLQHAESSAMEKAEAFGIGLTILRPTMVYGVGLDNNITRIAGFIRRLRLAVIYPPASGLRQPVHADDLAQAAIATLDNPHTYGKNYDVSGGEVLSYRTMVERIFHALGKRPVIIPLRFLPALFDMAGMFVRHMHINGEVARRMNRDLVFSHEKAECDFNYQPRAFLSGGKTDL